VLEAIVKVTLNLLEHRNRVMDAAQKAIDGIVDLMNDSLQRHPEISDIVQAHAKITEMAKKKTEDAEVIDNAVLVLDEYTKWLCANTQVYAQAYGPYGKAGSLTLVRTRRRVTWIITGFEWLYTFYDKFSWKPDKNGTFNPRMHHPTFFCREKKLHAPGKKDMIVGYLKAPKRVTRAFLRADADLARNDTNYRETQRHVDEYLAIAVPFSDALLDYVHAKNDAVRIIDHADRALSDEPTNPLVMPGPKKKKDTAKDAQAEAEAKAKKAEYLAKLKEKKRQEARRKKIRERIEERARRDGPDSKAARRLHFLIKQEEKMKTATNNKNKELR
uniref:hypothetical protein n=1 Tax=Candidatus Igneacidithiobacillus taiwanensis TaxID=1945924 RepID=UPI0028A23736